jgi:LPXTG-motif cell wall-anchored protein
MRLKTVSFFLLPFLFVLVMLSSEVFSMAIVPKLPIKKPPVKIKPLTPPPSAPEPLTLTLIGMGASGAAGYFLGKRREK